MYNLAISAFDSFQKLTLESPDGQDRFSLVPSFGATIIDLELGGQRILDTYNNEDEMQAYRRMKSALLFPFPNRLKDGRYIWNNDAYTFFINDSITNNALHGFGLDKKFEVVKQETSESHCSVACRYEYNGDLPAYPFPFTMEVLYKLKGAGKFSMTMTFYNDGAEAIPVGLGWHPYFKIGDNIDDLRMEMPPCEMIGVDKQMIPTGKRYEYDEFANSKKMGATILDNCFFFPPSDNNKAEVVLVSENIKLRFWQMTGEGKLNYMQIYTHPDRQSIAIEPMSCNVNAFNNGEGLMVLLPNEKVEVTCGVEVTSL
ncbi:MAG: aldose 1-epimerase [Saprospiraceae bacterium]